jgi:hypothetical protein
MAASSADSHARAAGAMFTDFAAAPKIVRIIALTGPLAVAAVPRR